MRRLVWVPGLRRSSWGLDLWGSLGDLVQEDLFSCGVHQASLDSGLLEHNAVGDMLECGAAGNDQSLGRPGTWVCGCHLVFEPKVVGLML